jgi:LPPG:FO 2-phospho-L-lactate transferase
MQAMGIELSPFGIASHYIDIAASLVISEFDYGYEKRIRDLGINVFKTNIVMESLQDEINLSNYLLNTLKRA